MVKSNKPLAFNSIAAAKQHIHDNNISITGANLIPIYALTGYGPKLSYGFIIQAWNAANKLAGNLCSDGVIRRIGPGF